MAFRSFVWNYIDKFIDGEVAIVRSSDYKRKYTIPSCYKDIYWPKYDPGKHGKHEAYRERRHLIESARRAIEYEDIRAFFRIYCLFAELKKQHRTTSEADVPMCGAGKEPKHLDYESELGPPRRLVRPDKEALTKLKRYAWVTEGIAPSPFGQFRVGVTSLLSATPFLGALLIALLNSAFYWQTTKQASAPGWLRREMIRPLLWACFSSFLLPAAGSMPASRISPNRRAARKLKHWLKMRSLMSNARQCERSGEWTCSGLEKILKGLGQDDEYTWRYSDTFRKKLYGNNLEHLYDRQTTSQKE